VQRKVVFPYFAPFTRSEFRTSDECPKIQPCCPLTTPPRQRGRGGRGRMRGEGRKNRKREFKQEGFTKFSCAFQFLRTARGCERNNLQYKDYPAIHHTPSPLACYSPCRSAHRKLTLKRFGGLFPLVLEKFLLSLV
jgi:hypothetical protein